MPVVMAAWLPGPAGLDRLAGLLQAVGLLARYSGDQIRRSVGVIKRGVAA
jgi:hypothetical protein